jgi:hypothetical protein
LARSGDLVDRLPEIAEHALRAPLERHRDADTQGNAYYRQGVSQQVLPGVGPTDETQQLHGELSPMALDTSRPRRGTDPEWQCLGSFLNAGG